MKDSFHQKRQRGAFTLIELLVVMTIMGILVYLAIPITASIQQSGKVGIAGQAIADEISVAREMAASRNVVVEVRFITPISWSTLGSPNYRGYHALQLWAPNESGTSVPADHILQLPDGIEISSNSNLSPLLSTPTAASSSMPTGATAGSYVSFYIRPAGNVQVANPPSNPSVSASSSFFTVVPVGYDAAVAPPTNYFTLQVNPDTGRTQGYRP